MSRDTSQQSSFQSGKSSLGGPSYFAADPGLQFQNSSTGTAPPADPFAASSTSTLTASQTKDFATSELNELGQNLNRLAGWAPNLPHFDLAQSQHAEEFAQRTLATFVHANRVFRKRKCRHMTAPPPSNSGKKGKARYTCMVCHPSKRKNYDSRGTLRRHQADKHNAEYRYICPHPDCRWYRCRKDKYYDHVRVSHANQTPHLKVIERGRNWRRPCPICRKPSYTWNTWEDYFSCVASHCRLPEAEASDDGENNGSGNNGRGDSSHLPGSLPRSGAGVMGSFDSQSGYDDGFFQTFGEQFNYPGANAQGGDIMDTSMDGEQLHDPLMGIEAVDPAITAADEQTPRVLPMAGVAGPEDQSLRSDMGLPAVDDAALYRKPQFSGANLSSSVSQPETFQSDPWVPPFTRDNPAPSSSRTTARKKCNSCTHDMTNCSMCRVVSQRIPFCHVCRGRISKQLSNRLATQGQSRQDVAATSQQRQKARAVSTSTADQIASQAAGSLNSPTFSRASASFTAGYTQPSQLGVHPENTASQSQGSNAVDNRYLVYSTDDPWCRLPFDTDTAVQVDASGPTSQQTAADPLETASMPGLDYYGQSSQDQNQLVASNDQHTCTPSSSYQLQQPPAQQSYQLQGQGTDMAFQYQYGHGQ